MHEVLFYIMYMCIQCRSHTHAYLTLHLVFHLLQSVSTQGGKSFDLHSSFGGAGAVAGTGAVAGAAGLVESPVSNTDPLSISSYFQRRTYALGEPFSEHRQPPENRVRDT